MGKFRKLFVLIAVAGAFIGASSQPANAQAKWRAYCGDLGGDARIINGDAKCFVNGKEVF